MYAVEMQGVTKRFGAHVAVDDLSLAVPKGSVYGFIGPNGSGKTTTMRMLMHILHPDAGTIRILADRVRGTATDSIGYMPEERGLYRKMKVGEILEFYGELKNGANVRAEAAAWLSRFKLSEWAHKKVETLSKGMMQKVQFIATVVARPELLILDEPFSGLDPVNADVIREAVLDLRRGGATVILSTHDMHVAERMCDYILMIHKGRKVLDGTLSAIQAEYGTDTIRVRLDGGSWQGEWPRGVTRASDFGHVMELQVTGERDPQEIVAELMTQTRIRGFEITTPSLHDIFVRIAGAETREVGHA